MATTTRTRGRPEKWLVPDDQRKRQKRSHDQRQRIEPLTSDQVALIAQRLEEGVRTEDIALEIGVKWNSFWHALRKSGYELVVERQYVRYLVPRSNLEPDERGPKS